MLLAIALLLAATPGGLTATQARLDQMVHRCGAEKVARLIARPGGEVVIDLPHNDRAPTTAENRQLTCLLDAMGKAPDLKFGFIGNEAE